MAMSKSITRSIDVVAVTITFIFGFVTLLPLLGACWLLFRLFILPIGNEFIIFVEWLQALATAHNDIIRALTVISICTMIKGLYQTLTFKPGKDDLPVFAKAALIIVPFMRRPVDPSNRRHKYTMLQEANKIFVKAIQLAAEDMQKETNKVKTLQRQLDGDLPQHKWFDMGKCRGTWPGVPAGRKERSDATTEVLLKSPKGQTKFWTTPLNITDEDDVRCIVCREQYATGDDILVLPCEHTFHAACIEDWLARRVTCPRCLKGFEWREGLI